MKLKGSVKKGKQEPKNHHQSQHSSNSHALFATDSLELKLAYTAINEHTNTHKRLIFLYSGITMVFLSNERRTIILTRSDGVGVPMFKRILCHDQCMHQYERFTQDPINVVLGDPVCC